MDFATVAFRRRRRLHFRLPLSCAKFELIYHTSLDSLCAGQVKLSSARFNQTVIILSIKRSKLETSGHSATVRGPDLVTAYKLSGLSGYR